MVDKLNKLNFNIGAVNHDLNKQKQAPVEEQKEAKASDKPLVAQNYVDPEKVLDAMKKHGIHNMNHVVASGNVGYKSITDAINFFTDTVSPEMHSKLTEKVKVACQQEFPKTDIAPDIIAEVVDNLLFDALLA